jgi:hypothetical protein
MKTRAHICVTVIVVFFTLFTVGTSLARSKNSDLKALRESLNTSPKLFTTYNMRHSSGRISSINYQTLSLLPVGTEVKKVVVLPADGGSMTYDLTHTTRESREILTRRFDDSLTFVTADGKEYRLNYHRNHSREASIWSFARRMFSETPPSEVFSGMDEGIIAAIKAGEVVDGMTMQEVVMTLGIPPDHKTPDAENNLTWVYWTNRNAEKNYCFDADKLATSCDDVPLRKIVRKVVKTAAKSPTPDGPLEEKMESLKRMFDKGLITAEEYSTKKKELLDKM